MKGLIITKLSISPISLEVEELSWFCCRNSSGKWAMKIPAIQRNHASAQTRNPAGCEILFALTLCQAAKAELLFTNIAGICTFCENANVCKAASTPMAKCGQITCQSQAKYKACVFRQKNICKTQSLQKQKFSASRTDCEDLCNPIKSKLWDCITCREASTLLSRFQEVIQTSPRVPEPGNRTALKLCSCSARVGLVMSSINISSGF